jgi:hypothetical protein
MNEIETMHKVMFDGIRSASRATFNTMDALQNQTYEFWNLMLEHGGKMRNEMDKMFSDWMSNIRKGREEIQLNMEEGLSRIEETMTHGDGVYGPWSDTVSKWPEMQAEVYRQWLGMWASPMSPAPEKTQPEEEKPKKESQAPKTK